jgi:CRISPR-associated endonuclease Csn1
MDRTLGLDLGTNSIGWALVRHDDNNQPQSIEAAGARIFQEAVDAKTRTPKNQKRRAARALRRIISRRRRRKAKLKRLLVGAGVLPPDILETATPEILLNGLGDPYEIRKRALDSKLEPNELGRALLHICARRGFQSNRRSLLGEIATEFDDIIEASESLGVADPDDKPAKKALVAEEGIVKQEIASLREDMQAAGARTLGEYLSTVEKPRRKRGRHTDRAMFKEEFETIWTSQARFHHVLTDDGLKARIFEAIFFQRPLKSAKHLIGRCSLEQGRRRAATARLECQLFRVLQDVNHLSVRDPVTRLYRDLDSRERPILRQLLHQQSTMTWGKARKALGLHGSETFNYEDAGKDKLKGNTTCVAIEKILGDAWREMTAERRQALVEDMLTIANKGDLARRLRDHWKIDRRQQYQLATLELEPGYMSHSLKAIRKMLPALEIGAKYHEAKQAAGYALDRPDTAPRLQLGQVPMVRNPVVQKSLFEVRRVVNALIHVYGKPAVIRIEMARDVAMSGKQKEQFEKQQRVNEKANARALEQLETVGIPQPGRDDLVKYRLWEECKGVCPYTGKPIGMNELFSAAVDIEHVVPYSRCLDDSYMNKTLCMAQENRLVKRGRTPWEAYGEDKQRWEAMLQRIKAFPNAKQRRFTNNETPSIDDFVSRQLNDTRYMAVEVKSYVGQLGVPVEITKGAPTSELRRRWALNSLLGFDPEKKERTDHRHHALDAVVIALTSRSLYQRIARASAAHGHEALRHGALPLPVPWPDFVLGIRDALDRIVVSHAVNRRISGAFHEETAYGFRASTGKYHYRKRLDSTFQVSMVDKIADDFIRKIVKTRLDECSGDVKKAFAQPLLHKDGVTPVNRVRLARSAAGSSVVGVKGESGQAFKFYDLGNNHHIEICEDTSTGRRTGTVISTLDAARRARAEKTDPVNRVTVDGQRFVMSLAINDMFEVTSDQGVSYYRVQKISGDSEITLRLHTAAMLDRHHERLIKKPNTLKGRKVAVDAIGRVTYASD